jgi:hypothetical protein
MEWLTVLVSGAMGILGAAVGATLAYQFSRRAQQEQWRRDCRRAEFRELMAELSRAYTAFGELAPDMFKGDDLFRRMRASAQFLITVRDRICIANEVKGMRIDRLWLDAVDDFIKTSDIDRFSAAYNRINEIIVAEASRH